LRKHRDPGVVNSARKRLFDACRTQPRGKEVASFTGGAEFTDHLRNRLLQNAFSGWGATDERSRRIVRSRSPHPSAV